MSLALQLNPFSASLEAELGKRLEVIRWCELGEAERAALLRDRGCDVVAIVAGGHIGGPTELIKALPNLKIVAINGVGFDKVDLELARSRGVWVTTTPGTLTEDVADLAVGLIISLLRRIPAADAHVRAGAWPSGEFPLARKVSGRRFGILGLGHIGGAIAQRLAAFGPVAYASRGPKPVPYECYPDAMALAHASDVLVVACSANAATRHMVGDGVLDALGPEGWLVNVSRGSVVDETALAGARAAGRIAGAALDVFENEPQVPQALRDSPKVVLTPHIASATVETRAAMAALVLANLDAVLAGRDPPTPVL